MSKLHFYGRPQLPLDQFSFGDVTLFINFNKREVIEQWSYETPHGQNQPLDDIGAQLLGKSLKEAFKLSSNFTGVGHAVYWQLGRLLGYFQAQTHAESDILCRCFGVSKKTVERLLDKKQELVSFSEVKKVTRASAGCGSCTKDIRHLVQSYCDQQAIKYEGFYSPKGESPIQFLLKLNQWQKSNMDIPSFKLLGIEGYNVYASWSDSDQIRVDELVDNLQFKLKVKISLRRQTA